MNLQNRIPVAMMGVGVFRMNQLQARTALKHSVANAAMWPGLAHVAALHFIPGRLGLYAGCVERSISDDKLIDAAVHVFDEVGCAVGIKHDTYVVNDRSLLFALPSGKVRHDRATTALNELESFLKHQPRAKQARLRVRKLRRFLYSLVELLH